MDSMHDILRRHGTDKGHDHNYGPAYEYLLGHLRNEPITLLEIGISDASLRAWEEIFPKATIIGLDNDPRQENAASARSKVLPIDHTDPVQLLTLQEYAPFDVIIDDGNHVAPCIMSACATLWSMLKPGGVYVIEDLEVSYCQQYNYEDGRSTIGVILQRLWNESKRCDKQIDRFTFIARELAAFIKL